MICYEDKLDSAINTGCSTPFGMEHNGYLTLRSALKNKSVTNYTASFIPGDYVIPVYQPIQDTSFKPKSEGEKNAYGLLKFGKSIEMFLIANTSLTQQQIMQLKDDEWVFVGKQIDGQNLVFGYERGLRLKTTSQELSSTETHGGILLTFEENAVNTPMLFTAENTFNQMQPSLKKMLIGNDTPSVVNLHQGGTKINSQAATLIKFNNKNYFYYIDYSFFYGEKECVTGGTYDPITNSITNQSVVFGLNKIVSDEVGVNCPQAFLFDSKVYMIVSSYSPNKVYMLTSENGVDFVSVGNDYMSITGFTVPGNHWLINEKIGGYYYWFMEGLHNGSWIVKLLKSTDIESGWSLVGDVTGLNDGHGFGGMQVFYDNGIFKTFYHYQVGSLPSRLAYAESINGNPLHYSKIYTPLLDITRTPFPHTDQIADPEIVEIDGKTYMFAEYMDNNSALGAIYRWETNNSIKQILNAHKNDATDFSPPTIISAYTNSDGTQITVKTDKKTDETFGNSSYYLTGTDASVDSVERLSDGITFLMTINGILLFSDVIKISFDPEYFIGINTTPNIEIIDFPVVNNVL